MQQKAFTCPSAEGILPQIGKQHVGYLEQTYHIAHIHTYNRALHGITTSATMYVQL